MDAIESQVRLPPGAAPLDAYARAYALAPADRVVAFYFTPMDQLIDEECQAIKAAAPASRQQIVLLCPPPEGMRAGERRWFGGNRLPVVEDGRCSFLNIEFDLARQVVTSAECNGH